MTIRINRGEFSLFTNCSHLTAQKVILPRGVYVIQYGLTADSPANSAVEIKMRCANTGANVMLDSTTGQTSGQTDIFVPLGEEVDFAMSVGVGVGQAGWVTFRRVGDY
jgi:hypothetical protein